MENQQKCQMHKYSTNGTHRQIHIKQLCSPDCTREHKTVCASLRKLTIGGCTDLQSRGDPVALDTWRVFALRDAENLEMGKIWCALCSCFIANLSQIANFLQNSAHRCPH